MVLLGNLRDIRSVAELPDRKHTLRGCLRREDTVFAKIRHNSVARLIDFRFYKVGDRIGRRRKESFVKSVSGLPRTQCRQTRTGIGRPRFSDERDRPWSNLGSISALKE